MIEKKTSRESASKHVRSLFETTHVSTFGIPVGGSITIHGEPSSVEGYSLSGDLNARAEEREKEDQPRDNEARRNEEQRTHRPRRPFHRR